VPCNLCEHEERPRLLPHFGGYLLDDLSFGVVGTITPLVDLWLDGRRLPNYMRAVPKRSAGSVLLRTRLAGDISDRGAKDGAPTPSCK
jgi:hypothetical protein